VLALAGCAAGASSAADSALTEASCDALLSKTPAPNARAVSPAGTSAAAPAACVRQLSGSQ
jgi:hypothetical protein